ncbi:unnamed protein product, partial [Rotaria magnacalcarata]
NADLLYFDTDESITDGDPEQQTLQLREVMESLFGEDGKPINNAERNI